MTYAARARSAFRAVGVAIALLANFGAALAQVPIPMREQVQLFNSLPPAQQQALIRELQRQLPPAQRESIVNLLQGRGDPSAAEEIDPEAAGILDDVLGEGEEDGGLAFEEDEPRLRPNDTIVIEFTPLADDAAVVARSPEQQTQIDEFRDRLARGNPYKLDGAGRLYLPGVRGVELAGLNVDQATVRVQAEPELAPFTTIITFLPLISPIGPFGYDLFRQQQRAFSQRNESEAPVPANYVLGVGDTVNIQLFGNENNEYFLPVNRDGTISFPGIGPITVSGLSFAEVRDAINQRVAQQMIGVRASVTLGELRMIRVFVLGDVTRPGAYNVNSTSTIMNALFASGGVREIGSLRNIALRRNGNTVSTLDLYDLLLRGDTSGDVSLQDGDAIFVPPIGPTVTVDGAVRRAAIYEVRDEQTLSDIIALAGGLAANANRSAVRLERVVPNRGLTAEQINLATAEARTVVRDGDIVRVLPNLDQIEGSVRLAGNVFQPGLYGWFDGMRLSDLLPSPELVRPLSDLNYVLIRRERAANVSIEALSADLQQVWSQPNTPANVALRPRDTVTVFSLETGRSQYLDPIITELRAQTAPNASLPLVRIGGQVRAAGIYPLEPGMRVSDLLRAGGGMNEAAYSTDAELTRYAVINGEYRETELVTVNLAALVRGDSTADLVLSPYDYLIVKEVSRWAGQETVQIRGEVVFPGSYPIQRGEKLSSVLKRAGGLTELAFPEGSVFTRVELRQREQEQIEVLASRIERDLAAVSVTDPNQASTIATGQSLITQLRSSVATGRLVIRLDDIVAGRMEADIVLKEGDQLIVPDQAQEVTVLGEVQYATSHLYERGLSRDDYIDRSGGTGQRADKKRIYVVRANGEVVANSGASWFRRDGGDEIRAGDAIVVPLDVDNPLARWTAITQIVYSMALAAAAVNSF